MGTWGTGLFSNDLAADLQADFRDLIADGKTPAQATKRLMADYNITVDDTNPDNNDFWLALAKIQHQLGHIEPDVIVRAIARAQDPAELERWEPSDRSKRRAVLDKLQVILAQSAPSPKIIKKRVMATTNLQIGQHLVWDPGHGVADLLLRVTDIHEDKGGRYAVVVTLPYNGSPKTLYAANRLRPYTDQNSPYSVESALGFIMITLNDPELRVLDVRADEQTPRIAQQSRWVARWDELYKWFYEDGKPRSYPLD